MSNPYNEDYYEHGIEKGISGYDHYRWLPELTLPMVHELITQLGISKNDSILDFGCAKGYLVKAFRMFHHNAIGADISEYAISQAPSEIKPFLTLLDPEKPIQDQLPKVKWVIAKDVLEHVPYEAIPGVLKALREIGQNVFVVVPLGDGNGKYVVPEYEQDVTHIIREGIEWWHQAFSEAGFWVTRSSYRMNHIKENWAHHHKGNGFFILR